MSGFSSNSPATIRKDPKPAGKLANFFVKPGIRSQSEPGGPNSIRNSSSSQSRPPDLMPQGKALNVGIKGKPPFSGSKVDIAKLAANETDERYQYLLKRAIIRRVEDEDKIIYAELPGLPGILVVYRKPSERNSNPERLNLDRRELTQMPLLEGEERLRLLNFQHNYITKIENLLSLPNLIFLDLYDNQIKEIAALHTIPSLRVLMLGKNCIDKLKNLQTLPKLDVLDLHSNKIAKIENISHLTELRVLNLANNQICWVENLEGLSSLTELNLRRNSIEQVKSVDHSQKLQRLFLSNNQLEKFEQVACLDNCSQLTELALDGNGLCVHTNYTTWVLRACPQLKHLDLKKITMEMKDQLLKAPAEPPARPTPPPPAARPETPAVSSDNLVAVIAQEWKAEVERLRRRGLNEFRRRKESSTECLVQSGHAELEGDNLLFIYGNALEILATKAEFYDTVEEIHFQYVRFDYIYQHSCLVKLKRFSKLKKLILMDNNLHSFIQLSKLETLPSLVSIVIDHNDVACTSLYRSFIVYRFPNVTEVNADGITEADKEKAKKQFQHFDKILCSPNILKPHHENDDKEVQKNVRLNSKKNTEFAVSYTANLISQAVLVCSKLSFVNKNWEAAVTNCIKKTTQELSEPFTITESTFRSMFDVAF